MPEYRSDNVYVTCNGETKTVTQWSRELGLLPQTLQKRLDLGWKPFEALYRPVRNNAQPRGTHRAQ